MFAKEIMHKLNRTFLITKCFFSRKQSRRIVRESDASQESKIGCHILKWIRFNWCDELSWSLGLEWNTNIIAETTWSIWMRCVHSGMQREKADENCWHFHDPTEVSQWSVALVFSNRPGKKILKENELTWSELKVLGEPHSRSTMKMDFLRVAFNWMWSSLFMISCIPKARFTSFSITTSRCAIGRD